MGRPSRAARPRADAFSLIELLVCVAIIALLLGILVPSLAGAREAGRSSVCLSNLKQLTLALTLYAQEHRDLYAPGAADFLGNLHRWHGARQTPSQPFRPEGGPLTPYIDGGSPPLDPLAPGAASRLALRVCPSFASTLAQLDAGLSGEEGFERSCGGYGYNNAYVGTARGRVAMTDSPDLWIVRTDRVGAGMSQFAVPAGTIAFSDSAFAVSSIRGPMVIEYSFVEPRFWPDQPRGEFARADPSIHFRHPARASGAANIAWLDGHAAPAVRTYSWSSGLYGVDPALVHVGWPGTSDENDLFDYE